MLRLLILDTQFTKSLVYPCSGARFLIVLYIIIDYTTIFFYRSLSWYFLIASNYFLYGESLVDSFGVASNQTVFIYSLNKLRLFVYIFYCLFLGIPTRFGQAPPFHLLLAVLWWLRLVRPFPGQTLLYETIFSICLDSRSPAHSRHSELPNHP